MRPVLIAGNLVAGDASARGPTASLPQATVELVHSRGAAAGRAAARRGDRMGDGADRDRAARSAALSAALFGARRRCWRRSRRRRRRAAGARRWSATSCCCSPNWASASTSSAARSAASTDDLVAVSPRSGRAVSAAEAEPYAGKLLPLPRFVREGGQAGWAEIAQGLDLTGHFLMRDVLTAEIGGPGRGEVAAGRSPAPGRRTRLAQPVVCAALVA